MQEYLKDLSLSLNVLGVILLLLCALLIPATLQRDADSVTVMLYKFIIRLAGSCESMLCAWLSCSFVS